MRNKINILFLDDDETRVQQVRECDVITYVRNKEEFITHLRSNPLPDVISYDHDIGCRDFVGNRPLNGEDLAKWAVYHEYVPQIVVIHSWNSSGAKNIALVHEGSAAQVHIRPFVPYKSLFEK